MPASFVDILDTVTTSDSTRCDDGDASGDIDDEGIIYLDEDIDDESDFADSDRIILYFSHILNFFSKDFVVYCWSYLIIVPL